MKVKVGLFVLAGLCFSLSAFAQDDESVVAADKPSYRVSLIRLLANPEEFNGKQVNVAGYMSKREVWHIFPSKDMCVSFAYSESLYVNPSELVVQQLNNIDPDHQDCEYVNVAGIYKASSYYGKSVTLTHLPYTEGWLQGVEFY